MASTKAQSSGIRAVLMQAADFTLDACEPRQMLSAATHVITPNLQISPSKARAAVIDGYTPAQIKAAYGFSGLKGDGTGRTIAIVDAYNDPAIAADLAVFSKQFGLPAASLTVVNQAGGSVRKLSVDSGWAGETALDVEWAHAIAPGAKILLVEATSDDESNLMAAVNYARSVPGVSVVSTSWGESEASSDLTYDSFFTTPAGHTGVTFVSSSGDEGSAYGPEFPASSPNVLAVGGTTLKLSSTGAILSETAWRDSTGGTSRYEKASAYQSAVTSGTNRTVPDVAYDADPNTGFAVYDSIRDSGVVGWQVVAGTSAGTPQWAALVAIADQLRAKAGLGALDGASQVLPTLYSLYTAPGSSNAIAYASSFNDITTGGSAGRGFGGRGFGFGGGSGTSAKAGYDSVTGLGSPKATAVVQALINTAFKAAIPAATSGKKHHATASTAHKSSQTLIPPDVAIQLNARLDEASAASAAVVGDGAATRATQLAASAENPSFAAAGAVAGRVSTIADPFLRQVAAVAVRDVVQASVTFVDVSLEAPSLTPAAAKVATTAIDVMQKSTASLHFPHFDPAVMFDDVIGSFANESASLVSAIRGDATMWAWAVTVAVLGVDAALLARWFTKARSPQPRRAGREALPALDWL